MTSDAEINLRIILESPPAGVDFALQKGGGNNFECLQKQRSDGSDLMFEFPISVKLTADETPNFLGVFAQGKRDERFVYIDIGTIAGQMFSSWSRRLKVPLKGITAEMIAEFQTKKAVILETRVAGTGRDGGPNCATVKPFAGWMVVRAS